MEKKKLNLKKSKLEELSEKTLRRKVIVEKRIVAVVKEKEGNEQFQTRSTINFPAKPGPVKISRKTSV